jgi:hypothetical protein
MFTGIGNYLNVKRIVQLHPGKNLCALLRCAVLPEREKWSMTIELSAIFEENLQLV